MKKLLSILIMCCICQMVFALDKRLDEINAIKKNPNYLYAESTMKSANEALKVARNLLREEIIRWTAEELGEPMDSASAHHLSREGDIMMMNRAGLKRVFVYINKEMVSPSYQPIATDDKPEIVQEETKPAPEELSPKPIEAKPEQVEAKDSSLVDDQMKKVLVEHFSPKPQKKQGSVIQKVMKARNFFELKDVMEPLKKSGEIKDYGKYLTAKDLPECYLIVYDPAGNIIAWLDKGENTRKNLKTGKADSIANYHGCGAIWFTINEQQ